VPQRTQAWCGLRQPRPHAKNPQKLSIGNLWELRRDVFVVDAVARLEVGHPQRVSMFPESADLRIHGIKLCVAEKADPQFEVSGIPTRRVHAAARSFPQAPTPVRRLLHKVAIGSRQKTVARPPRRPAVSKKCSVVAKPARPARDPFHFWQIAKDRA